MSSNGMSYMAYSCTDYSRCYQIRGGKENREREGKRDLPAIQSSLPLSFARSDHLTCLQEAVVSVFAGKNQAVINLNAKK